MINSVNNNRNISFTAIPLAKYSYLKEKGDVIVYQLEKKDAEYLKFLLTNIQDFFEKFNISDDSTKQVVQEAFGAGIKILKGKPRPESKAKILMSFYDGEPSSILIGNVLKVDKKGQFHYSSRKNHAKDETELDWLATWNPKIPGEGKVTVYEYFLTLIKDGFRQVFVRSEVPEKSSAKRFYQRMGFEPLSDRPRFIQRQNDNSYVIGQYDDLEDCIIPMKATKSDILNVIKTQKDSVVRKEIRKKSSISFDQTI